MPSIKLSAEEQSTCHKVASESILHGLQHGSALDIITSQYSKSLQQHLASFVTLHKNGQLRGCIGTLEAYQPLINDITEHAFAAAFHDSRFPALEENEFNQLSIEISVLSKPEQLAFNSEEDLLTKIRPGIDGLILEHDNNRGTFLPSVWEQLPEKKAFLNNLKRKAGLSTDWWSDNVIIKHYETLQF